MLVVDFVQFYSEQLRRRASALFVRSSRRCFPLILLNIKGNYDLDIRRTTNFDGLLSDECQAAPGHRFAT